ncbi:hypothetical protein [Cohnella hongkongensis]|uniref:HTH araC/xylS-type domain-containing protein n=1 Tax=Cohnella hongkongensis TaxID=178337 RepID=A0ABV9FEA0_9BACL
MRIGFDPVSNDTFSRIPYGAIAKWLQEIVFLSALEEVLSSSELAHRKEGEGPYPEQFELLNQIFGMSPKEFEARLESFDQHIQKKGKLGK